jgi:hypothetical protein
MVARIRDDVISAWQRCLAAIGSCELATSVFVDDGPKGCIVNITALLRQVPEMLQLWCWWC